VQNPQEILGYCCLQKWKSIITCHRVYHTKHDVLCPCPGYWNQYPRQKHACLDAAFQVVWVLSWKDWLANIRRQGQECYELSMRARSVYNTRCFLLAPRVLLRCKQNSRFLTNLPLLRAELRRTLVLFKGFFNEPVPLLSGSCIFWRNHPLFAK